MTSVVKELAQLAGLLIITISLLGAALLGLATSAAALDRAFASCISWVAWLDDDRLTCRGTLQQQQILDEVVVTCTCPGTPSE